MNSIDIFVQNYFSTIRTQGLTEFMYIISNIFDVSIYSAVIFICFIVLVYLIRGKKYSIFFASTVLMTGILVYILKVIFNTARPLGGVVTAFGASFPSYHATMSTVFFIMFMSVFNPISGRGGWYEVFRKIEALFIFIMVFLVSFSRIYLGVHWLSDVVFGVFLGISIFYFSRQIFQRFKWL